MIAVAGLFGGCCRHPSDDELLKNFSAHKTEFEILAQMAHEDSADGGLILRLDLGGEGVTTDRVVKYRQLMANCGIAKISSLGSSARFWVSECGIPHAGSVKGYAHLLQEPRWPVVAELDVYWKEHGSGVLIHRVIEGNWYLYLTQS